MLKKTLYILGVIILLIIVIFSFGSKNVVTPVSQNIIKPDEIKVLAATTTKESEVVLEPKIVAPKETLYSVTKVVDGDTIDVSINGKVERLRLIGINTPETVDPRKPVECFGVEASNKAKSILTDKKVSLESDSSQGELDKYNRLLRYVFLEDGTNFNLLMIKEGYAYEYTYNTPYKYQTEFKKAQQEASTKKAGLWGDMCQGSAQTVTQPTNTISTTSVQTKVDNSSCTIKGNISSTKEKIYHVIGCGSYNKTTIDESKGERWFCTEQEALSAGWRKALNCN